VDAHLSDRWAFEVRSTVSLLATLLRIDVLTTVVKARFSMAIETIR